MSLLSAPNIFVYSLPVAAFLIYVPYMIVAAERVKLAQSMDEPMEVFSRPRFYADQLPDHAKRANWAHQNSIESFILYAPAAVVAYLTGQESTAALLAVVAYLIARLLFSAFYILNVAPLRSLMFGIGSLSIFSLYLMSCKSIWLQ
ncbi:MAPEG family protein [Leptothoe kymatousa]|uniref:MAPEG family protein n=1 Tax=Leptothoe kymatousa TAU-MAC 1615 TaxID=2364775 RepID=A0ABS5Y5H7_9CYAN|nr:MAPEG family protein [Leptothoe kymatousa]MBT9313095.1 MAPEG family protein [Leptothoe kymatousa TAU-MAC 1615]